MRRGAAKCPLPRSTLESLNFELLSSSCSGAFDLRTTTSWQRTAPLAPPSVGAGRDERFQEKRPTVPDDLQQGRTPMTTMTHTSARSEGMTREERFVIFASSLGTVFEWYDFYLYATLAPFFASLFFPPGNDTAALLSAFATYAAEIGRASWR